MAENDEYMDEIEEKDIKTVRDLCLSIQLCLEKGFKYYIVEGQVPLLTAADIINAFIEDHKVIIIDPLGQETII